MWIRPEESLLLVIDLQEKLLSVMWEAERVVKNSVLLIRAARQFGVPILGTTQYKKGLGEYVSEVKEAFEGEVLDKLEFSVLKNEAIEKKVRSFGRSTLVICGVETHICVYQTVLSAKELGFRPVVVADATSSRTPENMNYGLSRMRQLGVDVVSAEMLVYEWLEKAGTPAFKALHPYLK